MKKTFHVRGLDCANEADAIRRVLEPLPGVERLDFNYARGEVTIFAQSLLQDDAIIRAIRSAGFDASSVGGSSAKDQGTGTADKTAVLCAASGLFVALGFIAHAVLHGGVVHALTAGEGHRGHAFPIWSVVFYVVAIITGGWRIAPKAWRALLARRPDMNLLMTIAVLGAVILGQWLEAATVTFLFALALWLESRSVQRARRAVEELLQWAPATAHIELENGSVEERPVDGVPPGSLVLVRPGEQVPLDGVVVEGASAVNEAPITGEWAPVPKERGDEVLAGSVNGDGLLRVRITKPAENTIMARMIRLVREAQTQRAPVEQWVDRFARYYTPLMFFIAVGLALIPPILAGGGWSAWFYRGLVLLVIACPCALVISTPVTIVAGLTAAARFGVLVKGGAFLERVGAVRAVAMDKTGTLTLGKPVVAEVVPLESKPAEEVLRIAAALEMHSTHPLAQAVVAYARTKGIEPPSVDNCQALPGRGVTAQVQGRLCWVGSHRLAHEMNAECGDAHRVAQAMEAAGRSVLVVGIERQILGLIALTDSVRPGARESLENLLRAGAREVVMLTGDHESTARAIAEAAGIKVYRAGLLPEEKVEEVKQLKNKYGVVAVIGDGVNDAPAMAIADVSLAMGRTGAAAALETADITLMADNLARVPWLMRHSQRTLRIVRQNIAFALGIKLLFLLLAVTGHSTLWMAIAADMGASLAVVANGLRALKG